MIIELPLKTTPKKNNERVVYVKGRPLIIQSKNYLHFEKLCAYYLKDYKCNIDYAINLKCTFYVPDRRKRDLTNLLNAIQDVLVKYKVLADDNYNIVQSVDGSRIVYKKGVEKTIIEIERS